MKDLEVLYVDALEQRYFSRLEKYFGKIRDEYYSWYEGCAGKDLLDGLLIIPG